jgi:type IV secretory pathway VirB6-like protein
MTRSLFDRYLKSLFSYMLQPVFVFAALLVLNFVVLQFIYTLFNFGVCSYCFMEIIIGPFYDECWIPGYESLVAMHSPDADGYSGSKYNLFTTFGNTLVLSLVFGTIAMSSPTFISSMAGLAAWIVTGSAMRHTNIGGAAAEVVGSGGIVVKQASRTKSRLSTWNKNRQAGNKKYDNQKTRKDLTKKNRALGFKDDSGSSNQDN